MGQRVEFSRNPEDWAPLVERVTLQWFYRNLGVVSLPMGIDVISQAIDILVEEKGMGSWEWLLEGRVLAWRNVPINGAARVDAYVIGSKHKLNNVVFIRNQAWKMWFIESLSVINRSLLGRALAKL